MSSVTTERVRVGLRSPQAVPTTSVVLWRPRPDPGGPALVFAHGAGTDLTHPTLRGIARGLAMRGLPVAVFNFAYAEAGRKRPDVMGRLEATYRDVLGGLAERFAGRPLVIGGRSMGGRVASHLVAEPRGGSGQASQVGGSTVAGLCLLGYPLHPAGRPERLRTGHWPALRLPILFVSGDRDRLCDLDLLERERRERLGHARDVLHIVRGADHGFNVRARDERTAAEVQTEVVGAVACWVADLSGSTDSSATA